MLVLNMKRGDSIDVGGCRIDVLNYGRSMRIGIGDGFSRLVTRVDYRGEPLRTGEIAIYVFHNKGRFKIGIDAPASMNIGQRYRTPAQVEPHPLAFVGGES